MPPAVPTFALYGEAGAPGAELLHVETLQSRSRLHRWEIEAHVHQGLHQIIWLRSGPAQVWLDAERQACEGPAMVVIPPGVVHAFRFAPASEGHVLTLSPRSLVEGEGETAPAGEALHALFAAPRVLALAEGDALRIGTLFDTLANEFAAPGPAGSPVPLWLARAVVWRLAQVAQQHDRVVSAAARGHQTLFTRFVVLVEAHHAAHWPIARYASRLGLTPERLNRLVRAQAGRSALELVHERLAREACRRLVYVAAPISQLAFELGFEDPAYFCRFFKRRMGMSPRAFRQRAAGAQQAFSR
ncbi:MAG: helix-turn-helix domain-containing protein [Burkholderiales bacterium]|nr:helix-turn-helix domain-containing protein [Burkholderiales bacterium]